MLCHWYENPFTICQFFLQMDENGTLVKTPPKDDHETCFAPFVDGCLGTTGSDLCDKAFNFHKCLVEAKESQ